MGREGHVRGGRLNNEHRSVRPLRNVYRDRLVGQDLAKEVDCCLNLQDARGSGTRQLPLLHDHQCRCMEGGASVIDMRCVPQ